MRKKSVVITGGLGFIGSAVAERFVERGSHVKIIDSKVSNVVDVDAFRDRSDVDIVETSVDGFFSNGEGITGADLLIHAASFVGPASIIRYQGTIGQGIVSDTSKVIRACLRSGVPLVYISSAEVYGRSGILKEDSDIRVPPYYNARIEYALAKLTSEAMVLNSCMQGLRSTVIRPFNVVGPRQSREGGFVMPTFVQQALGDRPLTVFGSGQQKRAFLGVKDLAEFLCEYVDDGVLGDQKIYNVGNPDNSTTIRGLAERVIRLLSSKSRIEHVDPKSIYGPFYYEAESFEKLPNTQTAEALGWSPKQSLDQIILETADFYKNHQDTRGADARK